MSSAPEDIEIALLLEGVFRLTGYDFRSYAPASLHRRIRGCVRTEQLRTVSALQAKVLHEPAALARLLGALSINVTALFRDPAFYVAFRERVVPRLRTYPFIRLWVAGCATGEEAYSLAILLQEEDLYDRCKIYATDMNEAVLQQAGAGVFRLEAMQDYTANYIHAGGKRSFSEYYTAQYGNALLAAGLRRNMLFALHNLVTDGSFNEFHVILCRNVLIYFNPELEARVLRLLSQSLVPLGFLCLGAKESLNSAPEESGFDELDPRNKIYCKNDRNRLRKAHAPPPLSA